MSEVVITASNFEAEVAQSPVPVLVDFWADWCGPCKMIAPTLAELAQTYKGKLKVGTINIDKEPDLATQYDVLAIPKLVVFKNGEIVRNKEGAIPKHDIEAMFKDLL